MKFILNRDVKTSGKVTFRGAAESAGIPMVESLFALSFVEQIHLFENVITITKETAVPWQEAIDTVKSVIQSEVDDHDPGFELAEVEHAPHAVERDDQPPEVQQIEEVLDRTVRPYLQGDGGDLDVLAYEGKRVVVSYAGACGTCPSSAAGTLDAIQSVLRSEIDPEIEVVSVGG
jgi:Fe-S cluster biogenesis protein NfuA